MHQHRSGMKFFLFCVILRAAFASITGNIPSCVPLWSFIMSKKKYIAASLAAVTLAAITTSPAFAQTASTSGIGAQIQSMAQEGATTSGFVGSFAMYAGALICFLGGGWALWQSRQPQNRENGRMAMGFAGLVLCGLFAAGGAWINKASNTTSGANASVTSTAGVVTFGGQ
jgi:hypothetical protein